MEQTAEESQLERIRNLALSGGLMGASLGALGGLFKPYRAASQLWRPAAVGGSAAGSLAAGSGYVGDELAGAPTPGEANPYTWRTALGGGTIGATAGGITGAAAGSGLLNSVMDKDSFLLHRLKEMQRGGRLAAAGKAGAIGALIGGAGLGLAAADEGMNLDVLRAERLAREKERLGL
jgi:hypothetical protein